MTPRPGPATLEQYAQARAQLETAERARTDLIAAWNGVDPDEALEAWVLTESEGTGDLRAASYVTDVAGDQLQEHAGVLLRSVKAAMDSAVHATATIVCTLSEPSTPTCTRCP